MKQPLVSILIPCFNSEPWVNRSIETALEQTWPNKEVIVLDDGSTDGSWQAVEQYKPHVQIERQSNRGQNASRNRLTAMSRGEWLVYLDADDELAHDSVAEKMEFSGCAEAIYGTMEWAKFQGGEKTDSATRIAEDYPDKWDAFFWWRYPNTSSFLFSRQAVLRAGGWDEHVKNCTDYALYLPMLLNGARFRAAPRAMSLYRNWSVTQATNEEPIRKMRTRLQLTWKAVNELRAREELTPAKKEMFQNAALSCIRLLYTLDPGVASEEHRCLREWEPNFRPSTAVFPWRYTVAYNGLGFVAAERLAAVSRARYVNRNGF